MKAVRETHREMMETDPAYREAYEKPGLAFERAKALIETRSPEGAPGRAFTPRAG